VAAENFKVKKGLEVGTGTTITSSGINVSGIITATQLVGDGSGLTNVVGSGSGIVVKDEGSAVGTAGTINFVGSGVVASLAAGQATITVSSGGLDNVVEDTTPQLGGNLDLNSKFITGSGGINVTGVVTATTLKGNGDFVDIDVDGNTELDNVSIAGITTISGTTPILDFTETDGNPDYRLTVDSGLFKIRNLLSGTYTSIFTINTDGHVDIAGNTDFAAGIDVTGNATFVNDIDVDGHTELDDLNVTGVSTFNNDVTFTGDNYDLLWDKTDDSLEFADNTFATFGGQGDLKIRHNTTVTPNVSQITNAASSQLEIVADNLELRSGTGDKSYLSANVGGATTLFYNDQQKLTTTGTGIEVPDLSVTGVGTIGQIETDGITLGTNATTFAAKFADNAVANFGTDNDLKIYHNDSNGFFINSKGQTRFENTDGNISIFASDSNGDIIMRVGGDQSSENAIVAVHNGEVILSFNGGTRITTTNAGAVVSGILTATTFSGSGASLTNLPSAQLTGALPSLDGSALTGITASGTGIIVQHDGSNVGTAGTINFSTNLDVSPISAGIVTVTASGGGVSLSGSTNNTVATVTGANALIGEANLTFDGNTLNITDGGAADQKILLFGTNPLIRFKEGSTNKGYIQWHSSGYLRLTNEEDGSQLRIKDDIQFSLDGTTFHKVWHAGNDGASSGLNADLLDGEEGSHYTNATNLASGTIPNARFPATLPTSSGANLTALNASEITSGTLPIARIADNAVTFAKMQDVATGVLIGRNDAGSGDMETLSASDVRALLNVADGATAGITTAATNVQVTWSVTANGSSAYRFTGPGNDGSDDNPDLYLVRGQRYRFINNSGGSHPFQIRSSAGGSAYNTGVTNNGASSGNIDFNVQHDAPTRLYYQCTSHGGMVGNIYITGGASWQTTDVNTSTTEEIFTLLNVGIGKNNPTEKLDVNGTVKATTFVGALTGNASGSSGSCTGNAATATALQNARTIGGVSFDGTANINLPGVNASGNQDTSGTAAVATRVTLTNQTGDSTCNVLFAQSTTGDQLPHTNANLTFNSTNGTLTATTFVGNLDLGSSNISSGTHTFTASAGSAVAADTTAVGSCNVIEYTIYISNSTNIQSQKVLIMDNGTTAYIQEFSVMSNPNLIATFSADVNGGNVRLLATPETGISGSTTIKFTKMIIE
jgi:hypothetical protein